MSSLIGILTWASVPPIHEFNILTTQEEEEHKFKSWSSVCSVASGWILDAEGDLVVVAWLETNVPSEARVVPPVFSLIVLMWLILNTLVFDSPSSGSMTSV